MSMESRKPFVRTSEYTRYLEDLQATAISVDYTGQWMLLAGRRHLALQNLNNFNDEVKKFYRNSKYEVSCAEFAICDLFKSHCAIATSQLIEVVTWHLGDPTLKFSLRAHTRVVTDIDWHSKIPYVLASCSIDTFTHLWDLRDPKKPILSLSAVCMSGATQVGFNRVSGNLIATAHDGDLRIWDIRKGSRPIQYITAHLARIHGINWSREQETHLVTASQDGSVKYFDINNPRRAERIITTTSPSPVWRARYTPSSFPDGLVTIIVPHTGSSENSENSLLLWNNSKNSQSQSIPIASFVGHTDVVLDFAFRPNQNPDSQDIELLTWSRDQTLRMWKLDGQLQKLCRRNSLDDMEDCEVAMEFHAKKPISKVPEKVQPSCSLQHEFSLIFFPNIPGIQDYELNPTKRNAMVRIVANGYVIILQVIFPSGYPFLNQAPVFEFCQGTSLDDTLSAKLIKVLKETAMSRVKKERTCLEQCLRSLVTDLKKESGGDKGHLRLQSPRLEGALSGVLDACIPFPKTSGIRFSHTGLLVTFSRPFQAKRINLRHQSTPRALSALSGGYLGNVNGSKPVFYAPRDSTLDRKSSRAKTIASTVVSIYDVSKIIFVSKELAEKYIINTNNVAEMCRHNRKVAEEFRRQDLIQCWTLAEMIASPISTEFENSDDEMMSSQNPFAKSLLESLITHFSRIHDVQTAAMLCCAFGRYCQDIVSRTSSFSSKSNTSQNVSPYHTVTVDSNAQTSLKYNAWILAQQLKGQMRSNSWSDSLDDFRINEINRSLLGDSNRVLYDNFKKAYAEMLYCWGLLVERAQVLKYLSTPPPVQPNAVEFVTECTKCKRTTRGAYCQNCKKALLTCTLCRLAVRGSANACLTCGHGGHTAHLREWFSKNDQCAFGCGCKCLEENLMLIDC